MDQHTGGKRGIRGNNHHWWISYMYVCIYIYIYIYIYIDIPGKWLLVVNTVDQCSYPPSLPVMISKLYHILVCFAFVKLDRMFSAEGTRIGQAQTTNPVLISMHESNFYAMDESNFLLAHGSLIRLPRETKCYLLKVHYGPLTRYVKLQVAHAPGMPGTFSPAADFKGNR